MPSSKHKHGHWTYCSDKITVIIFWWTILKIQEFSVILFILDIFYQLKKCIPVIILLK